MTPGSMGSVIAAVLTPPNRGAVAVVAVHGVGAADIVGKCFFPASGRPLQRVHFSQIVFGRWNSPEGEEVVVTRETEERVEVCCHGGPAAAAAILESLAAAGCRTLNAEEWLSRTEPDAIRAEAAAALAACRTERTAVVLLDQYQGALRRSLEAVQVALKNGEDPSEQLRALLDRGRFGVHLVEPWKVVLAGRPNVGKSSLINALIGYQRTLVFDQPGTTRDAVSETTAIEGWPVELTDTAGLRRSDEPLEQAGMSESRKRLSAADCVVLVCETGTAWTGDDQAVLAAGREPLVVYNKADLSAERPSEGPDGMLTSAVQGAGIGELMQAIARRLVPRPPANGAAVPFTRGQVAVLQDALAASLQGRKQHALELLAKLTRLMIHNGGAA